MTLKFWTWQHLDEYVQAIRRHPILAVFAVVLVPFVLWLSVLDRLVEKGK